MKEWIVNSDYTEAELIKHIMRLREKHKYIRVSFKTGMQRSNKQNAALHKYLTMLSDALNDAGLDMRKVLKPGVEVPWNLERAKEQLWRPIQIAMTDKVSTTEPEKGDYVKIYEVLNRHMAEKFGISLPWPCKETMEDE